MHDGHDHTPPAPENREMYQEIAALVGAIAKALEVTDDEAANGLEDGSIKLGFAEDEQGRFLLMEHNGRQARLYQGAIKHGG